MDYQNKIKKRAFLLARGLVSGLLLFYVFTLVEWGKFEYLFTGIRLEYALFGPLIKFVGVLFSVIRWRYLLAGFNIFKRLLELYIFYLIGAIYSLVLPGVIGGDLIRIGLVAGRRKENLSLVTASVLIERICGLTMLFVMGSLSVYLFLDDFNFLSDLWLFELMPPVTVLGVILFFVIFIIGRYKFKDRELKFAEEAEHKKIIGAAKGIVNLPKSIILVIFSLSALFQAVDITSVYIWAKSLHIALPFSFFFVIIPIVYLVTILPISLGGLGVREAAIVYFLTIAGINSTEAAALSFAVYLNHVVLGIAGGVAQIMLKSKMFDGQTFQKKDAAIN